MNQPKLALGLLAITFATLPLVSARAAESQEQPEEEVGIVTRSRKKRQPTEAKATPESKSAKADSTPADGQYGSRRIQLFLIPVGETAGQAVAPTQLALEGEVAKIPGYKPVDLVQELAVPPTAAMTAKLEEARAAIRDGNREMVQHQYPEGVVRYQRAVELYEESGAGVESPEFAEAFVRLGLARQFSGDDEAAKQAFRMAARFDLGKKVDGRAVDKDLGNLLERARETIATGPTGSLSVVTAPGGSRVFIGGVYRGTTPVTVDNLPIGINLVRLDRPGAYPVSQLVEVKQAQDVPVKVRMKFSDETLQLQQMLAQVPSTLGRDKNVPDMVRALGKRFRLERAVVATVEMDRTNVARVRAAVFDLIRDTRVIDEAALFATDAETGYGNEVSKWARGVFDRADRTRDRSARDPLDRGDGTEDWYSTDANRKRTAKEQASITAEEPKPDNTPEWERSNYKPKQSKKDKDKSKGRDPLDRRDGLDDW